LHRSPCPSMPMTFPPLYTRLFGAVHQWLLHVPCAAHMRPGCRGGASEPSDARKMRDVGPIEGSVKDAARFGFIGVIVHAHEGGSISTPSIGVLCRCCTGMLSERAGERARNR
jgi:hypothetical protein